MPTVTVKPINNISVRVNQQNQPVVHSTSNFVGSADVQQQISEISSVANNALIVAQNASNVANNKLDLSGGTITGNLTVQGTFSTANDTVDGGSF